MRLSTGSPAPGFTATTYDGKPVELHALLGARIYLAFFRFVTCPFCALRIHELAQRAPSLGARGLKILTVLQSSTTALRPSGDRYAGLFTILCDPGEELYKLYRLETSILGALSPTAMAKIIDGVRMLRSFPPTREDTPITRTRMPADFLIDEHGILQTAFYGSSVTEHLPFAQVEAFADRAPTTGKPPGLVP